MFSFLCPKIKRTVTATENPLISDGGASSTLFMTPKSPNDGFLFETTYYHDKWSKLPNNAQGATGIPPYHFHWKQEEIFVVEKGAVIFKVDGKDFKGTAADGEISVPGGAYHLFYPDISTGEDVVLKIWALPDYGADEQFFRNLFSYLEDCKINKKKPSTFQLLLFLHEHDISIAIPNLPKPLGKFVGKYLLGAFGGKFIGKWMLGYQASYKEYYAGDTAEKKKN